MMKMKVLLIVWVLVIHNIFGSGVDNQSDGSSDHMGTSSSTVVDVVCVSGVDNPCDEMGTHSTVDDHMMKVVYEDNKDNGVAFNHISDHHGLDDDSVNHTYAPAAANNTTATTSSSSANHTSRIEELIVDKQQQQPQVVRPDFFAAYHLLKTKFCDFLVGNVSPSEAADIFKCVTVDKEKADNRKLLMDLGPQIKFNRPQHVVDGYTRWMDRTDCAIPYTIHVGKECGIVTLYEMSLYHFVRRLPHNKGGFLNPELIEAETCLNENGATIRYLTQALNGYEFYLALRQYVLFIICLEDGK
nr:ulp1 protease family, C-terminal catalytic domain-containing protein [Tanacetum cinerariifolium]